MAGKESRQAKCKVYFGGVATLCFTVLVSACAQTAKTPVLADLKSRYWKGTYYLSVKESPTSIKCSIDEGYRSIVDIPVVYQGQDAELLFTRDSDKEKILALKKQCLEKSIQIYSKQ